MRLFGCILGKGSGGDLVSGLVFLLLALVPGSAFVGCAVEVGNPVAEDEPDDDRQPDPVPAAQPLGLVSLQLDVDGSLVNSDGKGGRFSDLRLNLRTITFVPDEKSGEPEVLDITGDLQTPGLFASGVEFAPQYDGLQLPPQRYTEIVLGFASETAGALLEQGGRGFVPVRLGSGMADTLRIPVDLQPGAEEPLAVVVAFDGDGSLKPESEGAYRFEPRGSVVQAETRKLYAGATDFPGAQVACAYSYALGKGSLLRRLEAVAGGIQNAESGSVADLIGYLVPRPVFDGKDVIQLDTVASCEHAFERAPIADGRYVFKNLTEGSYIIRAFASDGTFADVDEPLVKTVFDAINAERPKILAQADERIQRRRVAPTSGAKVTQSSSVLLNRASGKS